MNLHNLRLKRDSRTLHDRAVEALSHIIASGQYKPGDRLPPSDTLARQLSVSRPTLREALGQLEQRGVIVRRRGVGTFVTTPQGHLQAGLEQLESFRSLAAQAGVDEERGQWEVELAVASRQVAELLALSAGAAVVRVFMTATSNKLPFAYLKSFVPADRVEIEKLRAYAAGSLLDYLTESDQPPISFTHSRINAVPADPETADRLQVAPGRPLLRLAETFFAESGQPLSFSLNYFVTDLVEFHLIRRVVAGRDARGGRAAAV